MKRFTETDKWRDPWFRSLPANSKLIFFYLVDNCNNAGFHELDKELMVMLTGIKSEDVDGALMGLKRGIIGPVEGWYWIRRFLRHQKNEDLNPLNPAHRQIINFYKDQLSRFAFEEEFQEFIAPYLGLLSPTGKGQVTVKDQVKEAKRKNFSPPTPQQVSEYSIEIGHPMDGQAWCDSYEKKGWKTGKEKMVDWKAAVRTWKNNDWQPTSGKNGAANGSSLPEINLENIR